MQREREKERERERERERARALKGFTGRTESNEVERVKRESAVTSELATTGNSLPDNRNHDNG